MQRPTITRDGVAEALSSLNLVMGHFRIGNVDISYLEGPRDRLEQVRGRFIWALGVDDDGVRLAMPMCRGVLARKEVHTDPAEQRSDAAAIANALSLALAAKPDPFYAIQATAQIGLLGDRSGELWKLVGDLPDGLGFDPGTGAIDGVPTCECVSQVTLNVTSHLYPGMFFVRRYTIVAGETIPPPIFDHGQRREMIRMSIGKFARFVPEDGFPCISLQDKHYITGMIDTHLESFMPGRENDRGYDARKARHHIAGILREGMKIDILEGRLGPHRRQLYAVGAGNKLSERVLAPILTIPRVKAERVAAFVKNEPRLAVLAFPPSPSDFEGDSDTVARELLSSRGIHPSAMSRMSQFPTQLRRVDIKLASNVPVDWLPWGDDEIGWRDFQTAASVIAVLPDGYDVKSLAAGARGRWGDFLKAIQKASGRVRDGELDAEALRHQARDLRDTLREFEFDVVRHLLDVNGIQDDTAGSFRKRLSARILQGDRGIARLIEMSRRHHRDAIPPPRQEFREWEATLPARKIGDIDIIPLSNSEELSDEGAKGTDSQGIPGLQHCVGRGAYADLCVSGHARILSVRKGGIRLSTAELRLADTPSVIQHRGYGNAEAPDEACTALAAYMEDAEVLAACASIASNRPPRPPPPQNREVVTPEYVMQRFARWTKYLPAQTARLGYEDLERFAMELTGIGAVASPR